MQLLHAAAGSATKHICRENNMEVSQKIKTEPLHDLAIPRLIIHPKEMK